MIDVTEILIHWHAGRSSSEMSTSGRGVTARPVRAVSDAVQAFARWGEDGTWARIEQALIASAYAAGGVDLAGHVDSTVVRAHRHAAGAVKGGAARMNHVRRRVCAGPVAG
ncbi:hypothetical protein [Rhizocola hellebori]|uniref:hypothetical protein n=1 Tax=Rhizocola hellebori TaxID=1392758 RepID=UPI0019415F8D|nr:hypothetical protein [Rhizocola hellebori]